MSDATRVDDLFFGPVQNATEPERVPCLDPACECNAALRSQSETPLSAHPNVGDFRIIREIGRGGMGIVYEAEQVSLGRHVALKVLPRQLLVDSRTTRRFEREARAAAKLHHTNIVPVFGVGEHDCPLSRNGCHFSDLNE